MLLLPQAPDGAPAIEVHLRKTAAARRFSLRVSRLDGKVTLSMPKRARERDAMAFLQDHHDWLRKVLADLPRISPSQISYDSEIPILGELHRILPSEGRKISHHPGLLYVPGPANAVPVVIATYLKALARDRLAQASRHYAQRIGRSFSKITLRDTRSRWGSCSHDGTLMYSWRLVMAPLDVLDYVAAHEVAHLAEMNHSPDFWAVVEVLRPDWKTQRDWLKANGHSLHQFRFTASV